MELYFLKSAACLALLLIIYKLLLEKEDMHTFNRFYLLFSVVLSFLAPLITFTTYIEVPAEPVVYTSSQSSTLPSPPVPELSTPVWQYVLWGLYGAGVLFFGIKFGLNLKELMLKIRNNIQLKDHTYTKVLLKEEVVPHTFLKFIFLNKKKFDEDRIPREVFEHEQAHADQKHSYDILFMEFLQVILWFHPLLYLAKNAIKLNHEFLADKSVLKKGTPAGEYQQMLLAFSSGASHGSLAHPINYSFIKKRFTVMKTQTSTKAIWARSLLLIPLTVLLLYGFSTKEVVQRTAETTILSSDPEVVELLVDDFSNIYVGKNKISAKELKEHIEKNSYKSFSISRTENAPEKLIKEILKIMSDNQLPGSVSSCTTIDKRLEGTATAEMVKWYNEVAEQISSLPDPKIKSEDINKLNRIYLRMSPEQKKSAEPYPKAPIEKVYSSIQEKATPEMVKEYNKLAKYYNSLSADYTMIRFSDLERIKNIYNLMTEEQKRKAEPLPALYPPPPPPPPAPSLNLDPLEVPEPPVPSAPEAELEIPGPPSPPPSPQEHFKELAAQGARFFISGKGEISAKEAIKLVENKKNLSIQVTDNGSGTTVIIKEDNR